MSLFAEIRGDDALDVVIQPECPRAIAHLPRLRKARGDAVDKAPDTIPHLGDRLPLIDQDWGLCPAEIVRAGLNELADFGEV